MNTPLIYLQGRFLYEDKVMDGKYRKVTISTYDAPEKRSITVDKLQVDDPSGFFIELDRLRK